ncbi:MAG: methylated-DNA--[protein]-cysteine S-methyltransferase [Candidatus Azobacteroides sp.]|nr:methylated-DNA--[protein]-cysteine S-methyltransferase [Candidatus Azobacteroides sp.]
METGYYSSPVGRLKIQVENNALIGLRLCDCEETGIPSFHPVIRQTSAQLDEYFGGKRRSFDLPLATQGTLFQQQVWNVLQQIPYGKTISYAQLAERVGHPKACRAVGTANGKNPIAIIIPCHRVINANGQLGGYAYGLEMKKYLLNLEQK